MSKKKKDWRRPEILGRHDFDDISAVPYCGPHTVNPALNRHLISAC